MVQRVGQPLRLQGYASDYDRTIVAVEFSMDDGEHWTRYPVEGATSERWVRWELEFTPEEAGSYFVQVRSVNDRGEASPTPAVLQFEAV
ncbi:Mo-co oxidoreductase dimerisation domain [Slackia heliotrinireducens]|nr:Mo-co oxidoreductase dimerisation domain [Slackia heliotrinireducens]